MIKYTPDIDFTKLPVGTIIYGVPYENKVFDTMRSYLKKSENNPKWLTNSLVTVKNFDIEKCGVLFYCQRCNHLEDGSHRTAAGLANGFKAFDIQIAPYCFRIARLYGWNLDLVKLVQTVIAKHMGARTDKEQKWVAACEAQKWSQILKFIDFRGKKHLDVGCQSGYSCLRAWLLGAQDSEGWDNREAIIKVANEAGRHLDRWHWGGTMKVRFKQMDWIHYIPAPDDYWDVVTCMGMLHYLPLDHYDKLVEKLCFVCKEFLVLEMRLINNEIYRLFQKGNQTLVSHKYLKEILQNCGFKIIYQVNRPDGSRGIWIMQRVRK